MKKKPFKVLSLDGGGTFCLIQAKVLADLYPGQSGHEVLSHFDLVAACSGGAIVTALLVEDRSPSQILDLFLTRAHRIELFSALRWHRKPIRIASRWFLANSFGPRYCTETKRAFLHRILPTTGRIPLHQLGRFLGERMGHIRSMPDTGKKAPDLLIVTHDYDRNRAKMMRSNLASPAADFSSGDDEIALADAAHASSTAPVNWFDRPVEINGRRYWDGAMTGHNNPVLAGVTEAIALGQQKENIGVLTIGTTTTNVPCSFGNVSRDRQCRRGGFVDDLTKAAKSIVADPPDAHIFISHVMLGGGLPVSESSCPDMRTSVIRMNPVIQPVFDSAAKEFVMPQGWSDKDFARLAALDVATREDVDARLIERLADDWMRGLWYNQPIRNGGRLFEAMNEGVKESSPIVCEIGHPWYAEAKKAWQQM